MTPEGKAQALMDKWDTTVYYGGRSHKRVLIMRDIAEALREKDTVNADLVRKLELLAEYMDGNPQWEGGWIGEVDTSPAKMTANAIRKGGMGAGNPRFHGTGIVYCEDCPFEDVKAPDIGVLCLRERCPKEDTYTAACLMAEEAKGGKG